MSFDGPIKNHLAQGKKWKCTMCSFIFPEDELRPITVPHPKTQEPIDANQCPECGEVNRFEWVCDEPGCENQVTCGYPSPSGYRQTCSVHWRDKDKR